VIVIRATPADHLFAEGELIFLFLPSLFGSGVAYDAAIMPSDLVKKGWNAHTRIPKLDVNRVMGKYFRTPMDNLEPPADVRKVHESKLTCYQRAQ
jgi:hypothetical protein